MNDGNNTGKNRGKANKMSSSKTKYVRILGKEMSVDKLLSRLVLAAFALVLAGAAALVIAANYVLFPSMDDAVSDTIDQKFDLDTTFDFAAMANQGSISLEAIDINGELLSVEELGLLLEYKDTDMSLKGHLGDESFHLISNNEGMAASFESFNAGAYYGILFEKFEQQLENSVFSVDSDSEYALSEKEFNSLCDAVSRMQNLSGTKEEVSNSLKTIEETLRDTFEASSISDEQTNYNSIVVFGQKRNAKSRIFTINSADVIDFLEKLSARIKEPTESFDASLTYILEQINYTLGRQETEEITKEVILEYIDGAIEELKLKSENEDFELKIQISFVGQALSAVVIDLKLAKYEEPINLTVDLGAKPDKDQNIIAELTLPQLSEAAEGEEPVESKNVYRVEYMVEKTEKKTEVTLQYLETLDEGGVGEIRKDPVVVTLTLDKENKKVIFESAKEINNEDQAESEREILLSLEFDYADSKEAFSLTLKSVTVNGEPLEQLPAKITLVLKNKVEDIELPEHEAVMAMSAEEIKLLGEQMDAYIAQLKEKFKDLIPFIEEMQIAK